MERLWSISRRELFRKTTGFINLAAFGFALPTASRADDAAPLDRYSEILFEVKTLLEKQGVKGVTGIGPMEDGVVQILVNGQAEGNLPKQVSVKLKDNSEESVKLEVQKEVAAARFFLSCDMPFQHSGPIMGGDPVYNNGAPCYGTITFSAPMGSPITLQGKLWANHCVSCNHVLYDASTDIISTPNKPNSMKLDWRKEPPSGGKFVDLAGALINSGVDVSHLEVRGLERVKSALQPADGIRVSKYGAKTGLTSGKDLGRAWRQVDLNDPNTYYIRRVSGLFSEEGDSGAAVLDANRNFVGMVLAGQPNVPNEKYYMHALPAGENPPDQYLTCVQTEFL